MSMRRAIFAVLLLANLGLLLWGVQYVEGDATAEPEAQPPINADKILLLREMPANKLTARPKPPPPLNEPATALVCYRMGPLIDLDKTQQIETALTNSVTTFVRVTETSSSHTGYRVYLPSFKTREEAERRRRELTRLGFKDHAILQDDGLVNAISLGLYAVEANAQSHLRRLAQKGVKARLQAIEQTRTVYWLDLAAVARTVDLAARLGALLEGVSGAALQETSCPAPNSGTPSQSEVKSGQ
jgi:hypothetical protein